MPPPKTGALVFAASKCVFVPVRVKGTVAPCCAVRAFREVMAAGPAVTAKLPNSISVWGLPFASTPVKVMSRGPV